MVKRRVFTPDFKAQVVLEELSDVKDRAALCREHQLSPQVLRRWQEEFVARASEIFATEPGRGEEQERIGELERLVGRLTLELEVVKKASHILTSRSPRNGS